jgi:hypothetical protein
MQNPRDAHPTHDDSTDQHGAAARGMRAADSAPADDDARGDGERQFKRRIDCSPRSPAPSWSDDRFR